MMYTVCVRDDIALGFHSNTLAVGCIYNDVLYFLQFNHNQLEHWEDIDQLTQSKGMKTVYFEGNPISSNPQYRRKLKLALPSLTQIDATLVPRTM